MVERLRAGLLLVVLACSPSPARDEEARRQELRAILQENARVGERLRYAREVNRAFAAGFAGRVQPGVGCDVCPDLCRMADLRPVPATELPRLYRRAARRHGFPKNDWEYQLAGLELDRLRCMTQAGGPGLERAWAVLLDRAEEPAVRYFAAVQAVELGLAEDGRRALLDLASGTGKFAELATMTLDEWQIGIVPSL